VKLGGEQHEPSTVHFGFADLWVIALLLAQNNDHPVVNDDTAIMR